MNHENNILNIAYMNIHGKSKNPTAKQLQIQDFLKYNKIDILHMQYPLLSTLLQTTVKINMEQQVSEGQTLISKMFGVILLGELLSLTLAVSS